MRYRVIGRHRALTDDELRERFGYAFGGDRPDAAVLASLRRSNGAGEWVACATDDEGIAREELAKLEAARASDPALSVELLSDDATPVHSDGLGWCLWSDGRVSCGPLSWRPSRSLALSPPKSLSRDAHDLIGQVVRSASGAPACGWAALAAVRAVTAREKRSLARRPGQVNGAEFERLTVDTAEGPRELWCWWDADGKDYLLEVAGTLAEVEASAVEHVAEDDAARHAGVVDLVPEERGALSARAALGREPTRAEAERATSLWRAAWIRMSEGRL